MQTRHAKTKNDKVRDRLYAYPKLDTWIHDLEKETEELSEKIKRCYEVGASNLDGMPHGTDVGDSVLDNIIKIEEYRNAIADRYDYIADDIKYYYDSKKAVEEELKTMSVLHRSIIEMRYFKCMCLKDIYKTDESVTPERWNREHKRIINYLASKWFGEDK